MAIGGAGMRLSGAGYKKRRKGRRKRAKRKGARGGGGAFVASLFNPVASLASLVGRRQRFRGKLKGGGGRFLSGAVWHGYGKGSGFAGGGTSSTGRRTSGIII